MLSGVYAAVYKGVDANGNVTYSDTPSNGAIEIAPSAVNEVPSTLEGEAKGVPAKSNEASQDQKNLPMLDKTKETVLTPETNTSAQAKNYALFAIEKPRDQETIQNQPTFTVEMKIDPVLKPGDKIQLILDGKPVGQPEANMQIDLVNVSRGTHHLYAVLIDERNTVVRRSNEITIFVHRASILNPPNKPSATKTIYPIQKLIRYLNVLS